MLAKLEKIYLKIGIHGAPDGTFLNCIHRFLMSVRTSLLRHKYESQASPFWCLIENKHAPPIQNTADQLFYITNLSLGQRVKFNLDEVLKSGKAKGLALVFYMGMGDYLFTTPLIEALRKEYPNICFQAYASKTSDSTNSPLVGKLLEYDPNFNAVYHYDGRRTSAQDYDWRNYDYSDAIRKAPNDFLVVPVIYENNATTRHRVYSLFDTFGLARPNDPLPPILHMPSRIPAHVQELADSIIRSVGDKYRCVVCLQLEARSSNYAYPYGNELALKLEESGFFVVSFSPITHKSDNTICVDLSKFSIMDSIQLLAVLKNKIDDKLKLLTVTSVFGSVSSALKIDNLQMWHMEDEAVHALWFPNIHIVANRDYPAIPKEAISVFPYADREVSSQGRYNYLPTSLVATFNKVFFGSSGR